MKNIILGITGSIAAYKACDIVSAFKESGFEVTVVMTKEAKEFVSKLTFETLSENKVIDDMFLSPEEWDVRHISLAKKADLILIAPATANIISKIACGISDDALTALVLAAKAPIMIAPAMNNNMYENKIIQENIAKLKKLGVVFIGPVKGKLACGDIAMGHIAELSDIVRSAKKILSK